MKTGGIETVVRGEKREEFQLLLVCSFVSV